MIPVVLDTDIGTDIDDHYAVALALSSPELDVRLITTATGDTRYRAGLVAGLLRAAARPDVAIGIGPPTVLIRDQLLHLIPRGAEEGALESHAGAIHEDGVGAILDAVRASAEPVTVVVIGPATNIAAALERDPSIAHRCRLVAMAGWLGGEGAEAGEYNIAADVAAWRRLLAADWPITLAPLDTCAEVVLRGPRYARLREAGLPLLATVTRDYHEWYEGWRRRAPAAVAHIDDVRTGTSLLYDVLAVSLAGGEDEHVELESVRVSIDDAGVLARSGQGREVRAATRWRDLDGYLDRLVERWTGTAPT